MYGKAEAAQLRQAFWTTFGQYMAPVPSAEGETINWINYRTGLKHVQLRMRTEGRRATIGLELVHPDADIRALHFEQLQALSNMLPPVPGQSWDWQPDAEENGQPMSRVQQQLDGVSPLNREDWPALISFFKPRLLALDEFWSQARYPLEDLM
ncbi:hypothetical protein HNQ93_000380 [Hymenobacter luteus]|uniref:DUF4268 domain-containing protein n=2 Tax=Hymenobacter TaxID=89966 RepID=A0A7W9SX93_9BACT|nr:MULTISPECIES: DUF4268 domain-containing protein [Hymenobacter]MBB4600140.1 hypothetical protein [Hymenobacter latericoloratus]MBB6057550.1 hypothetical protein [Hymenobacter luteus]